MAIAKEWMSRGTEREVVLVGTERGIEMKLVPQAGLPLETLRVAGLKGKGGAMLFATWLARIPNVIFEPNAEPGLTNKVLARISTRIATGYEISARVWGKKAIVTGWPLCTRRASATITQYALRTRGARSTRRQFLSSRTWRSALPGQT